MTVRSWITISALVLIALVAAVALQFTRAVAPPEIVLRANEQRITGILQAACWPQRNGKPRCTRASGHGGLQQRTIPPSGTFRIVLESPAQPKDGTIRITDAGGRTVQRSSWTRTLHYHLSPGSYTMATQAGASGTAYVRYVFALRVTSSGS